MFNKNLVMAVKVDGKVLREFDGTVALPFGSEYTILLKNLSSQRASVKVSVDGQDATEGVSLIINAGESTELKRFIKNGNLDAGNAFKFIEKTSQIEAYRGNKAEDGLLTVTYEFEKEFKSYRDYPYKGFGDWSSPSWPPPFGTAPTITYGGGTSTTLRCMNAASTNQQVYTNSVNDANVYSDADAVKLTASTQNIAGITAPGSVVEQQFKTTYGFWGDGNKHTMTLKMIGAIKGQELVKKAVTVKKLQRCQMCGTNTKQTAKFCHNCGASVQIV